MKNFSLIKDPKIGYKLSPAYDMIAAELVVEGDDEELVLNLNGKKKKIIRKDFDTLTNRFGIDQKAYENILTRFKKALPKWYEFIEMSFLPSDLKRKYHKMIEKKAWQIELQNT